MCTKSNCNCGCKGESGPRGLQGPSGSIGPIGPPVNVIMEDYLILNDILIVDQFVAIVKPDIITLYQILLKDRQTVTQLILVGLTSVTSSIDIENDSALTTVNLNHLLTCEDLTIITSSSVSTINIGVLNTVDTLNIQDTVISSFLTPLLTSAQAVTLKNNSSLGTINLSALTSTTGLIDIENCPITIIPFTAFTTSTGITISNINATTLDFPSYTNSGAGYPISITNNTSITNVLFPVLTTITEAFNILGNDSITSLSFSALISSGSVTFGGTGLLNISLSSFTTGDFTVNTSPSLNSLSLPVLANSPIGIDIEGTSLTTLNFPAINNVGSNGFVISNNTLLTTLTINATSNLIKLLLQGNALNVTSVNNILINLDSQGNINGTIDLSGGTNASPTGAGIGAVVSLGGKGWIVTTN